jgi:hypothetical protein
VNRTSSPLAVRRCFKNRGSAPKKTLNKIDASGIRGIWNYGDTRFGVPCAPSCAP